MTTLVFALIGVGGYYAFKSIKAGTEKAARDQVKQEVKKKEDQVSAKIDEIRREPEKFLNRAKKELENINSRVQSNIRGLL